MTVCSLRVQIYCHKRNFLLIGVMCLNKLNLEKMGFPGGLPSILAWKISGTGFWWATVHCVTKSQTQLSAYTTHTHTHEKIATEETFMIIGLVLLHIVLILKLLLMLNYTINKVHWRAFYSMEVRDSLDSEVWL